MRCFLGNTKKKSTVIPVTRLWRRCGVGIGALGFRTEDKTVVVQCLGGGGGGDSHIKVTGMIVVNFEKNP